MLTNLLGYNILNLGKPSEIVGIKRGGKMKLSTRGRYGLMAMYQLALEYSDEPISLKYIAEKQGLSENYLEQLFSNLRKDGLIQSVRGAQGGYMLSRLPKDITVGEILRSLEGTLAPAHCVTEETDCSKEESCVTKLVMVKIKDSIDSVVDSITLQDMVEQALNIE
jgi:Rrf2 family cysteine metabolism transcriptional repressor